jgi:arginase
MHHIEGSIECRISMSTIDLIGVPFDGYGRPDNQAQAAAALRAAGLAAAFCEREVVVKPDVRLPAQTSARAPDSGLMNEPAVIAMADQLRAEVRSGLSEGHFPLIYGADCSVLLGAVPGLRDAVGEAGLVFLDGHEDATTLDASPDGEVANMEIALLLGLGGERLPDALRKHLPALGLDTLAMLGPRDSAWIRQLGVTSLVQRGVLLYTPGAISSDPTQRARQAVEHVASRAPRWWLHIDLDVLSADEFAAAGVSPDDPLSPGGLQWDELTEVVSAALRAGGCAGWSVTIYNPNLDPGGSDARRIVRFVTDVAPLLP